MQGYLCKAEILHCFADNLDKLGLENSRIQYLECIRNYMISYDKSSRRTHETACLAISIAVDKGEFIAFQEWDKRPMRVNRE